MGSNSSSNGGGGKTKFGYTKPKPKFTLPSVAILKGLTEGITKAAKESNLKRRKKFVKSKGLTSDDINMDASYLGSKEGLAELRKQGYTTVSDTVNTGGGNDNNGNQVVQAPVQKVEELPQQVKAPESVMTSEEARAKANLLLKKKRGTRTKSSLIATSPQGITDDKGLTLGQKSLLG